MKGGFASVELDGSEEGLDGACLLGEGDRKGASGDALRAACGPPERRVDATSLVVDRLRIAHPYLLSDVEPEVRDAVADLRETMHEVCKEE